MVVSFRPSAGEETGMFDPGSVRFSGPLTPYVDGFWRELSDLRYAPLSARNLLLVAAHFSRWLEARSLRVGDITDERVIDFSTHRRRKGYTQFLSPKALARLLDYLRALDRKSTRLNSSH